MTTFDYLLRDGGPGTLFLMAASIALILCGILGALTGVETLFHRLTGRTVVRITIPIPEDWSHDA